MQTISSTDLAHRLRPAIARLGRRLRQEAGGELRPSQIAALATDRAPRAADAVRARPARAHPAPHRDARARPPRGGRACVAARRRPGRPPLRARQRHRRRAARCSRAAARAQGRLPRPPARRARPRRARRRSTRAAGILERVLEEAARDRGRSGAPSPPSRVPNYRRYFAGQVVSITGNWMQNVAEMWLIVKLTGSRRRGRPDRRRCSSCRSCSSAPGAACSPTASPSGGCSRSRSLPMAVPGADAVRADRRPASSQPWMVLRARAGARHVQRARQPGAPVVRGRDGRRRPRGQRRRAELGDRPLLAHRRPGAGRRRHRAARRRRRASRSTRSSFLAMLVALRLDGPAAAAARRSPPRASRASCAARCAYVRAHARAADPAG